MFPHILKNFHISLSTSLHIARKQQLEFVQIISSFVIILYDTWTRILIQGTERGFCWKTRSKYSIKNYEQMEF